jgi:UDP-N-acetylmuramoylalanine--D-glutamate ligase
MPSDPLSGKKVVILGLARQGTALAESLSRIGARVTISDMRVGDVLRPALAELEGKPGITLVLGEHPASMLDGADLLCMSGGVPLDAPIVLEAVRRGIPLSNDAQIFLERCPCDVIGITGSAGKTTTTSLIGAMCEAAGMLPWVGGNIGNPLIADLQHIRPDEIAIMELSSFQLDLMTISPRVALITNITPNHLDRHKTMQAYIDAKAHILDYQVPGDVAVLNHDDPNTAAFKERASQNVAWFSGRVPVEVGAWVVNDHVVCRPKFTLPMEPVCNFNEIPLRGFHNVMNVLAACAAAGSAGVPVDAMRKAILEFKAVAHRLERVATVDGVTYINDSIATAPERVVAAINAFPYEPLIMLLGGRDKDLPWDDLLRLALTRSRTIITFGEAGLMIATEADRIRREAGLAVPVEQASTLRDAVRMAARFAQEGDVVLLSPGATSYDAYQDFEARGEHFRELVRGL